MRVCLVVAVAWALHLQAAMALQLRLYTHNIRFDKQSGLLPNEKPWLERAPGLIHEILYTAQHVETFVMLQETLDDQLSDILWGLNAAGGHWRSVGVGRDDGARAGEYSPILYQVSTWALEVSETVWFCDDQRKPGKCWGASDARTLTIARFKHRASGRRVVGMNTHLDNSSPLSRNNSIPIIQAKVREWCKDSERDGVSLPVFVGGDFNSPTDDAAYKLMTAFDSPLDDLRLQVGDLRRYGNEISFTGFDGRGGKADDDPPSLIDFLFLGPKNDGHWWTDSYACLPNVFDDGVYISDHRAVVGDVRLGLQDHRSAVASVVTDNAAQTPMEQA